MPNWGLTAEQRESAPWGIAPELLLPSKTLTDPVHGDIYLNVLEQAVLDTTPMQRLRRVRQLGMTHLVYPGATHSRFSHALGALRAAQDLLDVVIGQRDLIRPSDDQRVKAPPDLFSRWYAEEKQSGIKEDSYDYKVAEATVLVRLGALLHDLGHVSFGHSIEDELGILDGHDENAARFKRLWSAMLSELRDTRARKALRGPLSKAIRPLILSKEEDKNGNPLKLPPEAEKYPFAQDIVGNTICADLLDYIRRDHMFTGLPAEFGRRFLQGFYVAPADHQYYPGQMVMRIAKEGRPRADVISELFKFLRYRYELSERALTHHAKLSADAMVGKLLEMWHDLLWLEAAGSHLRTRPLDPDMSEKEQARTREAITKRADGEAIVADVDERVKQRLENEFLSRGDDGILEYLRDQNINGRELRRGLHELSTHLLTRDLFKQIGVCSSARASSEDIYEKHRKPDKRKALERGAAKCADIPDGWKVVVWIPPPGMRLKAAEVLVDDGNMVAPLVDYDETRGNRGAEIYASHKALWAVSVYVHRSVLEDKASPKKDVVRAYLAEKLGIAWDETPERPTLTRLAVRVVARKKKLSPNRERALLKRVETEKVQIAAKRGRTKKSALADPLEATFADLCAEIALLPID